MADYICREAILDDLKKEIEAGNVTLDEDVWVNKGLRIAIRDVKDIKAADVQPVKRGKMMPLTDEEKYKVYKDMARDYDGRCSLCNCCVYDTDIFCAECGARIGGDAE